ncbi:MULTISPECIES: MarR family winged helix-turn-helix transcriptional regulator [Bacillaceae]|jgi:DNA-binding MarR family transcriptional regulator|uniref:MarR family winged helix-turn-helix transcriptional regulator n=2 Tax=Ectobacillus funiculus TaxID=137993 RepID=A0ABV5WM97_9BACI
MIRKNAIALISRIRENASKLIVSELEKHGIKGMAPSHGDVLMVLYHHERVTMKQLAESIKRTKPTVTILVNKLVDLGFVQKQKDNNDSRVTYITLTKEGEKLRSMFFEISDKLNAVVYNGLSNEEQEQLHNILEKILDRF